MDIGKLATEMNRGFIQLLIMVMLDVPMYGYDIVKTLGEKGFSIDENTLYPLLRRLEEREILLSEWRVEENKPRKYYFVSDTGRRVREELLRIWREQEQLLKSFIGEV
ncbi:PadR family transcriptional regulator [Mesotoga sp. Brook.08.105.5.1]|jgi:DNA-binding PadR family transcriptional regulator|uniref:PadR family transcriptional regulator n=1 Tax=Mesotoga sp. Brook.08.105.5.1 TaxID=1421002 RepID=UPI000C17EB9C|nr:PadR family transcriptional regulator [Mesotoga sp. Brook.08.105.5.1]PVD15385.1 PadR family transcriptional regulator [Mesotoga sp. Brook.08.105.5.1]